MAMNQKGNAAEMIIPNEKEPPCGSNCRLPFEGCRKRWIA